MQVRPLHYLAPSLFSLVLALGASSEANAGAREQAKRIHDRLAGVPPSDSVLNAMEAQVSSGNAVAAAFTAMDNTAFYDVTLKNWIAPATNREFSVFVPLNDYTATVVGMARDDKDFRTILSADIIYTSNAPGVPAYANTNNDHYQYLEDHNVSLKDTLVQRTQSSVTGIPSSAAAGIWTTRAAAKAFFIDGTNRAQFRYTMVNHLCHDMEQVKDISRVSDRIRQDVTRSPGGDSSIFLNSCIGCHTGMDPLTQSFAYYNFEHDVTADPEGINGSLRYMMPGEIDPATGIRVVKKYHINTNNFKYGYDTQDDHWDNYWLEGPNKLLGWDPALPHSGDGASTMGQELSHSDAFAQCQVEKVFKTVCLRKPSDAADRSKVTSMISSFRSSGFKIRQVFAESAAYCAGD